VFIRLISVLRKGSCYGMNSIIVKMPLVRLSRENPLRASAAHPVAIRAFHTWPPTAPTSLLNHHIQTNTSLRSFFFALFSSRNRIPSCPSGALRVCWPACVTRPFLARYPVGPISCAPLGPGLAAPGSFCRNISDFCLLPAFSPAGECFACALGAVVPATNRSPLISIPARLPRGIQR
jgi:hypothetical protein